jgi:hypothetical protein
MNQLKHYTAIANELQQSEPEKIRIIGRRNQYHHPQIEIHPNREQTNG